MFAHRLISATRHLWRSLAECSRKVEDLRERLRTVEDIREARGISLLREWLSPEQSAQFDASKCFDVVAINNGISASIGEECSNLI